jgi:archaellum component FlaC
MPQLTRKPSALHLLELNATHTQTEQQALRSEVEGLKEALKRSHTAYIMLRDDVERFKAAVRNQQSELGGVRDEVVIMRREFATVARPLAIAVQTDGVQRGEQKEQLKKR